MPLRPPAGFIRPGYDPLKVPNPPTGVSATAGDASATVSFAPPSNVGGSAVSEYRAVSNPGQISAAASSSPVSVTGLTNGTSYTFTVWALNTYGPSPYSSASGSVTPTFQRALFAGGFYNVIDYVSISTTGNAIDFGDLSVTGNVSVAMCGCASTTRGIFASGNTNLPGSSSIYYVTLATAGNSVNFGNLSTARYYAGACNSSTRGIIGGGNNSSYQPEFTIEYITIATTGNALSFGNLTIQRVNLGSCSSPTRGVFFGGLDPSAMRNVIDYVTIATTGNATDFGDCFVQTAYANGGSNSTRGVFAGNNISSQTNVIQYLTIASTGNSIDFGDLTTTGDSLAACAGSTRAIWGGGPRSGGFSNTIDYVTIASAGNAVYFGDLTISRQAAAACSSFNGGVQ